MPVAGSELPAFGEDDVDRESLRKAIAEEKRLARGRPDAPVSLGGVPTTRAKLLETLERLEGLLDRDGAALTAAVSSSFQCLQSVGSDGKGTVLFTAYCSPCYEGSRTRSEKYAWPLRRMPGEAAEAAKAKRPFITRREIEVDKKLEGQGLELIWLARRLDAYLLEVQGSGSVRLEDGSVVRVQCTGTNGFAYTSLGKELIKDGKLTPEKASIPALRAYFDEHPTEMEDYLCRNKSYVFFKETTAEPQGCGGAAVTPKRSIATDKRVFPAGALAFVVVEMPVCENGLVTGWKKRARFVVDQDTGGAIVGPGRVDLYMGGDADGELAAGVEKKNGELYYLLAR